MFGQNAIALDQSVFGDWAAFQECSVALQVMQLKHVWATKEDGERVDRATVGRNNLPKLLGEQGSVDTQARQSRMNDKRKAARRDSDKGNLST